eukprot:CAMPEP_0201495592 /NCGR_PEP_ID=MMETSP0151_2-20130828/54866_1 /ASSEMBLY_ACC=CAM_ASM_000257 /TAXON_ID=200890 /ORGANISM="Paramoeba atlantica, Strain 621/1 / CCAP 1560/9" /LENGTH=65 /DNA_ID=CAMNT_0047884725 /DNA_START=60 /DNA_END=254 /DNA_ORIENTATION=+
MEMEKEMDSAEIKKEMEMEMGMKVEFEHYAVLEGGVELDWGLVAKRDRMTGVVGGGLGRVVLEVL